MKYFVWRNGYRDGMCALGALEGVPRLLFGHAGAAIAHLGDGEAPVAPNLEIDRTVRRGVLRGVLNEILQQLPHALLVGLDAHFTSRREADGARREALLLVVNDPPDHVGKVERLELEDEARVDLREEQQVSEDAAHPARLLFGLGDDLLALLRR